MIASDQARTETYGAANEIADKVGASLTSGAGNAQEVADAVLRIVETPAGKRELRYRVSVTNIGVDEINALCANVQGRMLGAFGLSDMVQFVQRTAAGGN